MTSTDLPAQKPCHPNLTKAEEENYDIDSSKIKEEEEECQSAEKKPATTFHGGKTVKSRQECQSRGRVSNTRN
jgi:hypothetical protein